MPEHASRFIGLYDQQNENRIPDWGGDDLFTRMPSPPAVDDAPAPRFRPSLTLVDAPGDGERTQPDEGARETRSADEAMHERAARLGISLVETDESPAAAAARQWEADHPSADWEAAHEPAPDRAANGRRTTLITGRPEGTPRPRPLSLAPAERRRPRRTPSEWIGASPERIVAWAFVLGLLLILLAISTADAATR
jgi:hypothetical protein